MDWQTTPFVFPILFGTALSALLCAVGLVSLRRDGWRPSVGAFVVLSAAVVVWTAAAAVKLLSLDPAIKLFAYKFLHIGASAVPPAWLAFTVSFTGREEWLQPRLLAAVSVPPVVFVSLLFLDPGTLVIADTRVVTTGGVETLEVDSGPLHTLLGRAYNLALVLVASTVVLAELWRRGRTYLPVATTILLATLVPLVVIGLEAFEVQPVGGRGVNVVPVSAAVSAALIGVATFRYGVLDLVPLAYRTVVESTPDGLVVVDADGTVRHANRPARRLLGLDADPTGRSAATVLPAAVRGDVGGEER
ncbi:MAG: histidine kinase N-terminal 7TM domain-containing protein, partial [Halobaculum sp.]